MANKHLVKRSSVIGRVPVAAELDFGELALNFADGKLYYKDVGGSLQYFVAGEQVSGGGGSSVTISDTAPASPQAGNLWWNSTDGYMYIYYTDADSSQWVVATPTFAFQTLAENVTGVVAAANGGTGLTSPSASGNVLTSTGTGWESQPIPTISADKGGTGLTSPGASGNVLTSTGTGWQSQTAAMVPPGTIITYAGSTAPSGYLVANNAAVSRTTYAALFAVIGTTYGAGDGSTTFNLPNLVNRMPIGSGGLYALGATGGSKDAVVVDHSHTITDPGHKHQLRADSDTAPDGGVGLATDDGINVAIRVDAMDNQVTGITVNSTGSSGTDANLPPYIGQLYCIKF